MRARDLGIPLPGVPGPLNAVTDVGGVQIGTTTVSVDTDDPDVAARTGVSHFSGDLFLAFSTANAGVLDSGFPLEEPDDVTLRTLQLIPWNRIDEFFAAVVHSVEEAVLNALVAGRDTIGRSGHVSPGLPHDEVRRRFAAAPRDARAND